MATDLGQLVYTLTLNSEGFQGQLGSASTKVKESSAQMSGSLKQTEEQSAKTGGAFSGMAGQFIAGAAIFTIAQKALEGIKNVLKDGVKNFEDWQLNQAQINNALKTTKDVSGQTTKSLNEYADSLSSQTGITGNAINQAQLMLLKYTSIGKDVFPGATKATADLATAMSNGAVPGTDAMTAASKLLGVALSDPEQSFGRLKKAGVVLTDQQKEQIKTMQKAGDVAGAQKAILDDLAGSIGGKAVTASHTLAGEQAQLHAQLEKVEIQIGQKLTAAFKAIEPYLVKFANWVMEHKVVLAAFAGIVGGLAIAFGVLLVSALVTAIIASGVLTASLAATMGIIVVAGAVLAAIAYEIATHWKDLKQWFNDFIRDIKRWFDDGTRFMNKLWQELAKTFDTVIKDINKAWQTAWKDIKQVVVDVVHAIGLVFTPVYLVYKFIFETLYAIAMWVWHGIYNDAVKPIIDGIIIAFHFLEGVAATVWQAISNTAKAVWNAIYNDVIKPVMNFIITVITNDWHIIDSIWQAILNFARPIWGAIENLVKDVWHAIVGVWQGMVSWFKGLFDGVSNAASGVGKSIGGVFSGIWNDIKGGAKAAVNEVINILNGMIRAYNDSVGKIPKAPHISAIPKFASGVTNFGGGLALLGEQGPELAYLPPGSDVYNNNQTQKMMQGSTYHIEKVILSTAQAVDEFFSIGNRSTQLELQGGSPLAGTTRV